MSGGCGLGCLAAADVGGGDFGFWRLRRILGCPAAADAGCGDFGFWRLRRILGCLAAADAVDTSGSGGGGCGLRRLGCLARLLWRLGCLEADGGGGCFGELGAWRCGCGGDLGVWRWTAAAETWVSGGGGDLGVLWLRKWLGILVVASEVWVSGDCCGGEAFVSGGCGGDLLLDLHMSLFYRQSHIILT